MIEIDFQKPENDENWNTWRDDCEKATEDLIAAVGRGEAATFSDIYKRGKIKEKYYL